MEKESLNHFGFEISPMNVRGFGSELFYGKKMEENKHLKKYPKLAELPIRSECIIERIPRDDKEKFNNKFKPSHNDTNNTHLYRKAKLEVKRKSKNILKKISIENPHLFAQYYGKLKTQKYFYEYSKKKLSKRYV